MAMVEVVWCGAKRERLGVVCRWCEHRQWIEKSRDSQCFVSRKYCNSIVEPRFLNHKLYNASLKISNFRLVLLDIRFLLSKMAAKIK